jgi:hypothetical protein
VRGVAGDAKAPFKILQGTSVDNVTDYRVYLLNDKGHILNDAAIVANDDAQAIEAAKKIVRARNVELWDGERLVGRFKIEPSS